MSKIYLPRKLKICFVVWFFPKLSETFVLNQIIELKRQGHQITIFAVYNPAYKLASEDRELETKIHEEILLYRLKWNTFYRTPHTMYSLLKKNRKKFDVVYIQFGDLAARILQYGNINLPTFVVFHNLKDITKKLHYREQRRLYKDLFNREVRILTVSEIMKQK